MTDKGLKGSSWTDCAAKMEEVRTGGEMKSVTSCRNRYRNLVKTYNDIKSIKANSTSGWGWDDERKHLVASEEVWNRYLQASFIPGFRLIVLHLTLECPHSIPRHDNPCLTRIVPIMPLHCVQRYDVDIKRAGKS